MRTRIPLHRAHEPTRSMPVYSRPAVKTMENGAWIKEAPVNQSPAQAELIATFRRAEADAAHKFSLIKTVANKGPKAIQMAVETASKAAKRRDSYAKKLAALGVTVTISSD